MDYLQRARLAALSGRDLHPLRSVHKDFSRVV
jgi:hypothetical protein